MTKTIYYKHYKKTKPTYQIINCGHVQIDNEWSECIVYQDVHSKEVYVRESNDFENKFSILEYRIS
jgi:hypothetical protein